MIEAYLMMILMLLMMTIDIQTEYCSVFDSFHEALYSGITRLNYYIEES